MMLTVQFVISAVIVACSFNQVESVLLVGQIQLCSKELSNALALICGDRGGYYGYSSQEESPPTDGPGIVEECCHRSCTIQQFEMYCKESSTTKTSQRRSVRKRSLAERLSKESFRNLMTKLRGLMNESRRKM